MDLQLNVLFPANFGFIIKRPGSFLYSPVNNQMRMPARFKGISGIMLIPFIASFIPFMTNL